MNRFLFVSPRNGNKEVIECAVKLIESNFDQLPDGEKEHHHLFIDTKQKHFFFTDVHGMNHLRAFIPFLHKWEGEVTETNLNEIKQWQKKQIIKT